MFILAISPFRSTVDSMGVSFCLIMILFDHARERVCPEPSNYPATVIVVWSSVFFFFHQRDFVPNYSNNVFGGKM